MSWYRESRRHSLARKGIKSPQKINGLAFTRTKAFKQKQDKEIELYIDFYNRLPEFEDTTDILKVQPKIERIALLKLIFKELEDSRVRLMSRQPFGQDEQYWLNEISQSQSDLIKDIRKLQNQIKKQKKKSDIRLIIEDELFN